MSFPTTERHFSTILRAASALVGLLAIATACADSLPTVTHISLDLAQKASAEAMRKCQADGHRVSVSVVDRSGILVLMARSDGAGPHTVESSRRKAYTAASLREPTQKLAEMAAGASDLRELGNMNESILLLGGGFPIRISGDVVGGLGVGGAPGVKLDEACARAGLQSIGAELYDSPR
jgi:uncharacterized protein GlcG (DUF336 family)